MQADVVARVLAGERTLAVMPTGAGKSLCYQLPAVMLEGTCVVVSPLIALMHDQLRAAEAVGIRAATLTSVDENRAETIERFRAGALDLLYIAPERASTGHFRDLLGQAPLALFAIDEAHCVSEWGHDFRPDYRLLEPLLDAFPECRSAGADRDRRCAYPRRHLQAARHSGGRDDRLRVRSPQHPLRDQPEGEHDASRSPTSSRRTPGPGIVYAQTRAATEKLAEALARTGRPTRAYHAGLDPRIRRRRTRPISSRPKTW